MLKRYYQNLLGYVFKNGVSKIGIVNMHSKIETLKWYTMEVKVLPALKDNYMYLLTDHETKESAAVDPVEPEHLFKIVKDENLNLTKILTTHHHWDHASGNETLIKLVEKPLEVYGGDKRIPSLSREVSDGTKLKIGNLNGTCLFTPCHTSGHVCYYIKSKQGISVVFTGDTLFQAGCGRFFEGTPQEMYCALCQKLAALPDQTKVFCGHEYTLQNMAYAAHVDPKNELIQKRLEWAKLKRKMGATTLPSTIGQEKQWNPFMRVNVPSVQVYAGKNDPISTMKFLRKEKDVFKV